MNSLVKFFSVQKIPSPALRILYRGGPIMQITIHLLAILSVGSYLWMGGGRGISLGQVFLALAYGVFWYILGMFATTFFYHRYLTHGAFKMSRLMLGPWAFLAASTAMMGPSWWVSHHRHHHRYSDQVQDLHRPREGFWWSHMFWLFTTQPQRLPLDIEQRGVLRVFDRLYFVPTLIILLVSVALGTEYAIAYLISLVVLFHAVQCVNSVCHCFGTQPFDSQDQSRSNPWVALLTLGEGFHNPHHTFSHSARHGVSHDGYRVILLPDPTFWLIQALAQVGLVSDIRLPSLAQWESKARSERRAIPQKVL